MKKKRKPTAKRKSSLLQRMLTNMESSQYRAEQDARLDAERRLRQIAEICEELKSERMSVISYSGLQMIKELAKGKP